MLILVLKIIISRKKNREAQASLYAAATVSRHRQPPLNIEN
jgi:hypothetical protein